MPCQRVAVALLALSFLGPGPAWGGRPSRLAGATLEAAKRDWRTVQAGRLTVDAFKSRYRISNGAMTRLRRKYPGDFGKLDRRRDFTLSELGRMQRDWDRIASGEITLTQFKERHRLGTETYDRLLAEHGALFPKIELKLGGSRLAARRREKRNDPDRVHGLSAAWKREVLAGGLPVARFHTKHHTSKREITALRKDPRFDGWFPSASGGSRSKPSLEPHEVSRLSQLWKQSVVPGLQTITAFKRENHLTQRGYRELRQDSKAFPDPARTAGKKGHPPRRTFSAAQLERMAADWHKVLALELPRATFVSRYRMHSRLFKRLRDEHPGMFPDMGGLGGKKQFPAKKLDAMRNDWLLVVAGRQREVDFRKQHGLTTGLFARFRTEPDHAPDFPKLRGTKVVGDASLLGQRGLVTDWTRLEGGQLSPATFRRRHPGVHAVDLLGLKDLLKRAAAAEAARKPERPTIAPRKVSRLEQLWPRVRAGEVTQKSVLARVGVPEHRLQKYRKEHPGALPGPRKHVRPGSRYDSADLYSAAQLEAARALFARYHRGGFRSKRELGPELAKLGISSSNQSMRWLYKKNPAAFCSKDSFLRRNQGAIIGDLVGIAKRHRHVIRKWSDFLEVVAQDESFAARWGSPNLALEGKIVRGDREGDQRLYKVMAEIGTQMGKSSGPHGSPGARAKKPKTPDTESEADASRRHSARALRRALADLKPTKQNLERAFARLARADPNFGTRRKALGVRSEYEGVFPELARWNFDTHRPYSLRYMARWTQAAHQAGYGASYEKIAAIFKRTSEYREDGRLPPKRSGTAQMAQHYPELVTSWSTRRTYQRTRRLLELLRTGPAGATLYGLRKEVEGQVGISYRYAQQWVGTLEPADAERCGMKRETFEKLRRGGFRGLGEKTDPGFDPNAEPPGVKMQLVDEILRTPTMPPMLDWAIQRLDGRLPFKAHNVMFVNHRYSDIVSLVDAMTRAGMECKNSVFVSTPYPFRKSVSYQLRRRGLRTIVPRLDSSRFALAVEVGIRRMLRTHEQQRRSWGHGKPILILDDGGMAAKIIAAKFPEHVSKFRIVEITAAGHRLAREFKEKYKRLPLVYYSLAYTRAKKKVTSRFFGTRVADRVVNLIPQTGIRPKNKRVAILGGGPMGIYVGIRLRSLGYDVTFVDPDRKAQRKLRWLKFDYKPIEEALPGRSIILGMSGYRTLKRGHLRYIDDGAFVAQGSSKRREFDMVVFETKAKKTLLPRTDGLAQKSYTYTFKPGPGGKSKRLHFLGDGWTINHDGSLHGTPMRDIQLELALYFESAVQAASTPLSRTGAFREVSGQTQRLYYNKWRELTGQR